ncbi:YlxR family protein [Caloramator sp. CAR-1]|uniref:RNase P modulator RnpM n=1 Tax=Caloramator sp. CAR-1 TaxID=3062777 RepID=UPI0026E1B20B|nr:YlxR family protein [Caloramator sp. CAR-1]MDO6354084.1 YlxR family protein [Caloramator sp. CAR-1]
MKVKKIPMRMCLGCQEMKPKKELIRVVRSPEGDISIDMTGKKAGRGAYICKDINCLEKAIKAKRFEKALEVKISEEIYQKLREELKNEG